MELNIGDILREKYRNVSAENSRIPNFKFRTLEDPNSLIRHGNSIYKENRFTVEGFSKNFPSGIKEYDLLLSFIDNKGQKVCLEFKSSDFELLEQKTNSFIQLKNLLNKIL